MFLLAKRKFHLVRAGLVRAALPESCARLEGNVRPYTAMVAVKNVGKLGQVEAASYVPPAILISGAMCRKRLLDDGIARSWMFVEAGAFDIHADDQFGCNELMDKLRKLLTARYRPTNAGQLDGYPYIIEVYPFENYFIYTYKADKFKQLYELDNKNREVSFVGAPKPVVEKFVEATVAQKIQIAAMMTIREPLQRVQTGIRYADAPVRANIWLFTTGGRNSELVTQVFRNMSNIENAVRAYQMYRTAVNKTPMTPAFSPVQLTSMGKIAASLAKKGVDPYDFATWASGQIGMPQAKPAAAAKPQPQTQMIPQSPMEQQPKRAKTAITSPEAKAVSEMAWKKTKSAMVTGTQGAHQDAANAHFAANKLLPVGELANAHLQQAQEHMRVMQPAMMQPGQMPGGASQPRGGGQQRGYGLAMQR
jgi:hypothetical protein